VDVCDVPRIARALLFKPTPYLGERGFFCRIFDAEVTRAAGIDPCAFVQHSLSRSKHGVIRGLHVRRGKGEAKLIRCSYGAVFDVIVDLRPTSPTFRNWESFDLRDGAQRDLPRPSRPEAVRAAWRERDRWRPNGIVHCDREPHLDYAEGSRPGERVRLWSG
jgi:dTDP-4-dehydrorhamnose 3,5-epimerase